MGSPAEIVVQRLTAFIGPQAARSTVNTFCKRTVGVKPEAFTANQMILMLPSLQQFLSVMLGAAKAASVIADLRREFSS